MKRLMYVLFMMCVALVFSGCPCGTSPDASIASDATVDAPDAEAQEAGPDAEAGAAEPTFCAGRPSAGAGQPEEYRGALDSMSCACERARGDRTCLAPASQCIVAPSQPAAYGCHPPCDPTDPGGPCPSGYACVQGYCWFLCETFGCPGEMLQCVPYNNPVAGTRHVCVPKLGYVP